MPSHDAVHEVIAHFLTDFPLNQRTCKTQEYIRQYLTKRYSDEFADKITTSFFTKISRSLIEEYDHRLQAKELLRYKILDDEGERIAGMGQSWQRQLRVFQDALNALSYAEFEFLSARILQVLGCDAVWVTPASHDQGLDSFGYAPAFPQDVPQEITKQCRVVYLAQAKHNKRHAVGSRDLREFVGSVELAIHRIFSTEDEKYEDLTISPFGPCVMVLVTTEELPRTVKTIGRNAGIVVLSASDLAILFSRTNSIPKRSERKTLVAALKRLASGFPTAR